MPPNVKRAQTYMQEYDLKGLIATTPTNVSYLTDLDCWAYRTFRYYMAMPGGSESFLQSYAAITSEGERILVAETVMSTYQVDRDVELHPYGGENKQSSINNKGRLLEAPPAYKRGLAAQRADPSAALVGALEEKGIRTGRVGIELENLSPQTRNQLKRRLPDLRLLDCTHLIRLIRMVKTEDEVLRLAEAQKIGELALVSGLRVAKVGGTFGEVLRTFRVEVAKHDGVTEKWNYWANGYGLSENHEGRIVPGIVTGFDGGCSYKMYYCDTGTTLVVGRNRPAFRTHQALFETITESLDSLRPGSTPARVMSLLSKAGDIRNVGRAGLQAHGIGLESREHPVIKPGKQGSIRDGIVEVTTELPLEKGMVINIETPFYVPGKEAYQVERCFLIRDGAPQELTPKRESGPFLVA